jgi:hypothetical protein
VFEWEGHDSQVAENDGSAGVPPAVARACPELVEGASSPSQGGRQEEHNLVMNRTPWLREESFGKISFAKWKR